MARIPFHKVANDWKAVLDVAVTTTDGTSVVLADSGASGAPDTPFFLQVDSEIMRCTDIDVDTPSAGKDTLTVVRGADGTIGATHLAGALVQNTANAGTVTELQAAIEALQGILCDMAGAGEGVIRSGAGGQLKAVPQGTPDMTVKVQVGGAFISGQPVYLATETTTAAMVAPSAGNDRIDVVQIDQEGTVSIKTGTEGAPPSAPAVDADNLKLAEILLSEETTSITASEITDSRVFL